MFALIDVVNTYCVLSSAVNVFLMELVLDAFFLLDNLEIKKMELVLVVK